MPHFNFTFNSHCQKSILREKGGSSVALNEGNKYYTQVIWQLGVYKTKYCDSFVFASHSYHMEKSFFKQLFSKSQNTCSKFYMESFIPSNFVNDLVQPPTTQKNQLKSERFMRAQINHYAFHY